MVQEMRGLTQYIADLRACRVRELEEKRINKEMAHIRQKFKEGNLDGRQKKKYLAKVVFTYILGYHVDIGHMEAVNLISSPRYSEKQIGYLALTLLMHENSDLFRLVVNSIRKDLDEHNEANNCLALHAIANIGGSEIAEALSDDVHRLLVSPTSSNFVKKKAALTLLRLYRKLPDVIPAKEWALRLVSLMDDPNLGVALSVTSLVMALASDHLDAYAICYQKAVNRLSKIVLEHEYSADYVYYKVPIPWLQVKLLRLLQYYPPTDEPVLLDTLEHVLERILKNCGEEVRNVQHNNAQHSVLFEAINLAIHLNPDSEIVQSASTLLGRFIMSKETNLRYLGLDTLTHLAGRSENLEAVKRQQNIIMLSLRDRDISVRRRGLDLLYSMCDTSNSKAIVGELLKYLSVADYTLREELVLKIAILTERFAVEYEWYIDTILRLTSTAGDYVGEEVWHRIIQIVTNTEELQEYAARKIFDFLRQESCHENIVKIGAYILGEYGHLVADEQGKSPIEQFHVLHSRSNLCSIATRRLLLTTYFKWLNLFPEIHEQLVAVFEKYSKVVDAEMQQRACEYLAIAKMPSDELLQVVADEMPPYEERESALLNRLLKRAKDTSDKRTWHVGGRDVNKAREEQLQQALSRKRAKTIESVNSASTPVSPTSATPTDDIMTSLAGLDLTTRGDRSTSVSEQPLLTVETARTRASSTASTTPLRNGSLPTSPLEEKSATTAQLTHGTEKWFNRFAYSDEGVLYEDGQIQIGVKSQFKGGKGRLSLFFGNKLSVTLQSFTTSVDNEEDDALVVIVPKIPSPQLTAMTQIQQVIELECRSVFTEMPILNVSYLAGSLQSVRLRLPVLLSKFAEPTQLDSTSFFERWKNIGGPPREAQKIFSIALTPSGELDTSRYRKVIEGAHFGVLAGVDPNPNNVVGAAILHTSQGGKIGCLLRLEPNKQAKLCRLTVRTTNETASAEILETIQRPISVKA